MEKDDRRGQLLGQSGLVGGGERAHALSRAFLECSKEGCPRRWIQAEHGLVHDEQVRVVNQSLRDEKLLLHSVRVLSRWDVERVVQAECREQRCKGGQSLGSGQPVELREQEPVLHPCEILHVNRRILYDADPLANVSSVARVTARGSPRFVEKLERSRAGGEFGRYEAKQRALPGSVRAHHDHPVPGGSFEGNLSQTFAARGIGEGKLRGCEQAYIPSRPNSVRARSMLSGVISETPFSRAQSV